MKEYTLFVGGYTRPFFGKEGGEGIYVFGMNPETGALTLRSTNHQAENPTFLQQRGSLLYSVGELDESEISAFRISEDKTQVTLINKLPLGNHTGYGTQLTLWPDNRHISSANYRGGSLSVCTLGENGEMDRICNTLIYEGSGPDKQQDGSHVHFSLISPGGYLLVANLGCDTVTVYKMDAEDKLHRMENMSVRTPAGRGPRHMCFSRDGSRLLISCECSNTVLVYEWSEEAGVGDMLQEISVLQAPPVGFTKLADIQLSHDGRYVYVCVHGTDQLCCFSFDGDRLSAPNWFPSGGKSPRAMAITEDDKFIVAANANMVAVLPRDPVTGEVGGAIASCPVGHSTCVTIMK